jgi:hypothetical protein
MEVPYMSASTLATLKNQEKVLELGHLSVSASSKIEND